MNKVYYFEVDSDHGGVFIAAKNLHEARNMALHTELISDDIGDYGFLSLAHQCCGNTTNYEGELSRKQLDEIGVEYTKGEDW